MVAIYSQQVLGTTKREWHPTPEEASKLSQKAEELWPDRLPFADANRRRWMSAVKKVRGTGGGWVLDQGSAPRNYY